MCEGLKAKLNFKPNLSRIWARNNILIVNSLRMNDEQLLKYNFLQVLIKVTLCDMELRTLDSV